MGVKVGVKMEVMRYAQDKSWSSESKTFVHERSELTSMGKAH